MLYTKLKNKHAIDSLETLKKKSVISVHTISCLSEPYIKPADHLDIYTKKRFMESE